MSAELVIFLLVATVAIVSAAFMLTSRNAVHSALFLVLNFLCVAFFYLMLNAPFLAAVQITVYAGAIMVLFMFVIMLLGADKLGGTSGKFSWIGPVAAGITALILILAYYAVTRSGIGLLQPVPKAPEVGVLHAVPGAPNVDVYLDDTLLAKDVAFAEPGSLAVARAGEFTLVAFPSCTEEDASKCVDPLASGAAPLFAEPVKLDPGAHVKFVVVGTLQTGVKPIAVTVNLSEAASDDALRVTFVNAFPGAAVDINELDPAKPAEPIELAKGLAFGAVSTTLDAVKGTATFAFQRGDDRLATMREIVLRGKTHELIVLAPEADSTEANPRAKTIRYDDPPLRTAESFGGPQSVGISLMTTYALPFELVGLLLLAAMVGAIVLAREEAPKRVRERIVVSPALRRMNRSIAAQQAQAPTATSIAVTTETTNAEASAD
jgi:NADH:ubiquinone oxidoreductase subunit 6 (subunit J)